MNNEWYTPEHVLDKVREVLGEIELDPASCALANERVKATEYYTSGLDKEWKGKVFCNPPYSAKLLKQFTTKFDREAVNGNMSEGIILTNSGTDTLWNQSLADYLQVYTVGRISFLQPDGTTLGSPGRGQCFTYWGPNARKFVEVFCSDGFCWLPNWGHLCLS